MLRVAINDDDDDRDRVHNEWEFPGNAGVDASSGRGQKFALWSWCLVITRRNRRSRVAGWTERRQGERWWFLGEQTYQCSTSAATWDVIPCVVVDTDKISTVWHAIRVCKRGKSTATNCESCSSRESRWGTWEKTSLKFIKNKVRQSLTCRRASRATVLWDGFIWKVQLRTTPYPFNKKK